MTLFYRLSLNSTHRTNFIQWRQYATSYKQTLNMPVTKFPAFVKNAKRPQHDGHIREKHLRPLYHWQRKHLDGKEFILHDGPPYANGELHMGHAVNKISKDIILRSQMVNGNRVHYRPGWDCHGLPIEMKAKSVKDAMNPLEIRKNARDFATTTIEKQRQEFESWGITGDWTNKENISLDYQIQQYRTYDAAYIKNQLNLFYKLYSKKLIFRDLKPVYWSPSSKTALAEAELEYDKNHVSPSLYIRFKLRNLPDSLKKYDEYGDLFALIWTTTPWTLPANQAVCFNPSLQYSLVRLNDEAEYYIVGSELIPKLKESLESVELEEVTTLKAEDLEECTYAHPIDRTTELRFVKGSHVTADVGTGLVHTAPSHGFDDYLVCLAEKIPIKCLVDNNCKYTNEAPEFLRGKNVIEDGNQLCLNHIEDDTIQLGKITHSCPIDWRTKQPVIINATHQWFIDITAIRDKALSEIEKINIFTTNGAEQSNNNQLSQKIKQRPYWCISRQRVWGTPIPVFYKNHTDEIVTSENIIKHINSLLESDGDIDFWWSKDVKDLIPSDELKKLNLNIDDIKKGNDILDIWFDSGISWSYAIDSPNVADLYLEGYDQFTGWFQSSLITSVAARDVSPFKSIFVHGFTVDEKGMKMSKSLGNVTYPKDLNASFNVDTLRWWVAAHLVGQTPLSVKKHLFEESANAISKIRQMLRYLVGYVEKLEKTKQQNNHEFNINLESLSPLDIYMLNSLAQFEKRAQNLAANYRFPLYINNINEFVAEDLSSFYIHNIKDRMYCNATSDTAQTMNVLFAQFCILNKVLWPIVPHLVEEVWSYYCKSHPFYNHQFSVPNEWQNTKFDSAMKLVKQLTAMLKTNVSKDTWKFDVIISGGVEQIQELQKLHPSDGQSHNDSHLCEILQVQSIQLRESPNSQLSLEKRDIDAKICDRCRRFAISTEQLVCKRCEAVLKDMEFITK